MRSINFLHEEQVKNDILNASAAMFRAYGIRKTTIGRIAKASGYSIGSLYYYFRDKEDILNGVVRHELCELHEMLAQAVQRNKSPAEQLYAFMVTRHKYFVDKVRPYPYLSIKDPPAEFLYKVHSRSVPSEMAMVQGILNSGVRSGDFKHLMRGDINTSAALVMRFLEAMFIDASMNHPVEPVDALSEAIIRGMR